eukprot:6626581-Prymnesium_polylepis.2
MALRRRRLEIVPRMSSARLPDALSVCSSATEMYLFLLYASSGVVVDPFGSAAMRVNSPARVMLASLSVMFVTSKGLENVDFARLRL